MHINVHVYTYTQIKWSYYTHVDNASPKDRLFDKNPGAKYENRPFRILITGIQEYPKTIQDIVIHLGCIWKINDKILLLSILHTSDLKEQRWNPPPWGTALIVPVGSMQVAKSKKQLIVLPSSNVYKPQKWLE